MDAVLVSVVGAIWARVDVGEGLDMLVSFLCGDGIPADRSKLGV